MNTPLRTAADVAACIAGVKDGTLDCLASDHARHLAEEKGLEFANACFNGGLPLAYRSGLPESDKSADRRRSAGRGGWHVGPGLMMTAGELRYGTPARP